MSNKISPFEKIFSAWEHFLKASVNSKIFGAAITIALMTAFVKIGVVCKELIIAWRFGTGDEIDAFLIAFLVPSFLIFVTAYSFNPAFIPAYILVKGRDGSDAAQKLFSGVMVWSLGLFVIAAVLMALTAHLYLPIIASGFSRQKLDLTCRLLFMISPIVPLIGMQVVWGGVLNAREKFALAAIVPMVTPILSILLLVTFYSLGVYALVVGLITGAVIELAIVGVALKKQDISLRPRWYGFDNNLRQVWHQYLPLILGSFLTSGITLVNQSMAAMLSPGSVATLNYGSKVVALPIGLGATALGTAVTPYFSGMVAAKEWESIRHTLSTYLKLIFLSAVPLTILILLISEPIIQLIFERGAFSSRDTYIVARVQSYYALQIPFYFAGIFLVRLISSLRANKIIMWASAINLLINLGLNYIFMHIFGVAGIALSTSIVLFVSFCYLFYFTRILLRKINLSHL